MMYLGPSFIVEEEIFESDQGYDGDGETGGDLPTEEELTGPMAYVMDYKMFIAARRIQALWRGHCIRKLGDQRWKAAITIQRCWRGFRLRRHLWEVLERRLQRKLWEHYHRAATRIQALFRGWRSRRHIHDMGRLRRMQISALEELLHCLIVHLHQVKKNDCLPGTTSLQEARCMSKIEHLQTIMMFRYHNGRMISIFAKKMAEKKEDRRHFFDSRFNTVIPYAGHNVNHKCDNYWDGMAVSGGFELLDPRMIEIATKFQDHIGRSEYLKKLYSTSGLKKRQECHQNIIDRESRAKISFCEAVIGSMRGWKIWNGYSVQIGTDIFRSPENLADFFKQVQPVLDESGLNCNCVRPVWPVYQCKHR